MKQHTKLAAILALAALAVLLCAGCGKRTPEPSAQPPAAAEPAQSAPEQKTPEPSASGPSAQEPSVEPEPFDALVAYAPVLDENCDLLLQGLRDCAEYANVSPGVWETAGWGEPETRLAQTGYALADLNEDGVPELLIGDIADGANLLYGGYSFKDGAPVCFLEGWARNRYQWLGNGRFYNAGSSGAAYSAFGTFRLSADGTELLCEDFYFTDDKPDGGTGVVSFHNTSGAWDTAASEQTGLSDEAFWALSDEYEAQCLHVELMPFSTYPYVPADASKVRADYLEDVSDSLTGYVNAADLFGDVFPTDAAYETTVVFRAIEDVRNFRVLALTFLDVDEAGHASFEQSELFTLPELRADEALAVPMSFPGDIPSNGFSYEDADGTTRLFTLSMSGMDGSLVVAPLG